MILIEGVPAGIDSLILPSGVWGPSVCEDAGDAAEAEAAGFIVHQEPWRSASDDLPLAKQLLQKDIDAGALMHLPGGEPEARARWGEKCAAGKLDLVKVPGKKPRLIGDATVSGANGRCSILEKVRLPTLCSVQRLVSAASPKQRWSAFSFDIRGAHKLIRVRQEEQGY